MHLLLKNENLFILNRLYSKQSEPIKQDIDTGTNLYMLQPQLSEAMGKMGRNITKDLIELILASRGNESAAQETRRVLKVFISFYSSKEILEKQGRYTEASWHVRIDTREEFKSACEQFFKTDAAFLMSTFESALEEIKSSQLAKVMTTNQDLAKATREEELEDLAKRAEEAEPSKKRERPEGKLAKSLSFSDLNQVRTPKGEEFETAVLEQSSKPLSKKKVKQGPDIATPVLPLSPPLLVAPAEAPTQSRPVLQLNWDPEQIKTCSQSALLIFNENPTDFVLKALEGHCTSPEICKINGKPYPTAWLMVKKEKLELFFKFLHANIKSCGLNEICEDQKSVREAIFGYFLDRGDTDSSIRLLGDPCFHGTPLESGKLHIILVQAYLAGKMSAEILFSYLNGQLATSPHFFSLNGFKEGDGIRNQIITKIIADNDFKWLTDVLQREWFIAKDHAKTMASSMLTFAIKSGNTQLANAILDSGQSGLDLSQEVPMPK